MRGPTIAMSRRDAVVAGTLAITGTALGIKSTRAMQHAGIQSGGGVAGGGTVDVEGGGTATFALFGSRFVSDANADPTFFGKLTWRDSNGVVLEVTEVSNYGPVQDEENARLMSGFLSMNGTGFHQFSLKVVHSEAADAGDRLTLRVLASKDATVVPDASPETGDVVYGVDGVLTSGAIEFLTFEFPV